MPALYSPKRFYLAQNEHNIATAPKQVIDNAYTFRISRRNGIVEAVGSIPSGSTNNFKDLAVNSGKSFLFTPPYPHKHIN